jgi:hypothetical protein
MIYCQGQFISNNNLNNIKQFIENNFPYLLKQENILEILNYIKDFNNHICNTNNLNKKFTINNLPLGQGFARGKDVILHM